MLYYKFVKNLFRYIKDNKVLIFVISFWFFIGILFIRQLPYNYFSHDFGAHVEYTKILVNEHRMPKPHEGWETHQQPIYYLIASIVAPKALNTNLEFHTNCIRLITLFFGAITLVAFTLLIQKFISNKLIQLLLLLFIATTPKFMLVFSTYNNDSLATMFGILIVLLSYEIYQRGSTENNLFLLFLITVLGLYSKLTVLIPIIIVISFCIKDILTFKYITQVQKNIVIVIVASLLTLLPWVIFNNYSATKKFFPSLSNSAVLLPDGLKIGVARSLFATLTPISVLEMSPKKWKQPWVHSWTHPCSKRNDYWSFNYITSIIGEHEYKTPSAKIVWIVLFAHLFLYAIALSKVMKSSFTKLAGVSILISHLIQIAHVIRNPYSCNMDFRYIAWIWLPWLILYMQVFLDNDKWYKWLLPRVLIIGIICQMYILLTISG